MARIVVVNLARNSSYCKEGREPHEKYNFKETPLGYYAYFAHRRKKEGEQKYVQDKKDYKQIDIVKNFGVNNNADKASNVFVIFVFTKLKEKGKWIAGYYENADVYKEPQDKGNPNISKDGKPIIYFFHSEKAENYLPDDSRGPFDITSKEKGSGFMGRFIWYPKLSNPKVNTIIRKMLLSINKLDILNNCHREEHCGKRFWKQSAE